MSTARTETRTSSWRTPTLRGLRQSLSVTRRTKQPVEEPLQLDANGLRKALAIGSDLIASPIVDHVRQQRDMARREGEWEGAEVDRSCGGRSRAFLPFSIVKDVQKGNMHLETGLTGYAA